MIETYSQNITVAADTAIPLNSVALLKGTSVTKSGATTLQFNCRGIYELTVSASAAADTVGNISIQLEKDGVLQPQAISTVTAANINSLYSLGFTTLVQVSHDNGPCCCTSPTNVDIVNTGEPATFDIIDVVVTKIC